MNRTPLAIVAATLVTAMCAACGGSATPAVTVTAAATTVTASPIETPMPASSSADAVESTPAAAETTPAVEAANIKVPNGVGKDYQSAQDLWRAAGLHVAPATDATGAHRLPVIDSNWVVLSQDLKAGSTVPADTFITATVKKYSDS